MIANESILSLERSARSPHTRAIRRKGRGSARTWRSGHAARRADVVPGCSALPAILRDIGLMMIVAEMIGESSLSHQIVYLRQDPRFRFSQLLTVALRHHLSLIQWPLKLWPQSTADDNVPELTAFRPTLSNAGGETP